MIRNWKKERRNLLSVDGMSKWMGLDIVTNSEIVTHWIGSELLLGEKLEGKVLPEPGSG